MLLLLTEKSVWKGQWDGEIPRRAAFTPQTRMTNPSPWGMGLSPLLILGWGQSEVRAKDLEGTLRFPSDHSFQVWDWCSVFPLAPLLCRLSLCLALWTQHHTVPGSPAAAFPVSGASCPCMDTGYSHNPVLYLPLVKTFSCGSFPTFDC